jgi:hypothetical protein
MTEKLEPLPIDFDEASHRYTWRPTGEVMPYSVTTVTSWDMSADKRANIDATRDQWERRGNACHHALESLLTGQPFRQDDLDEFDEWITPLLDHAFWKDFEVLASEFRMIDLKRGLAGSCDAIGIYKGKTILLDLKSQKGTGKPYSTNRQLGGYIALLYGDECHKNGTSKLWIDECRTVWARPGKTTVGKAQDPTRCLLEFCDAWDMFQFTKGDSF